MLVFQPERPPRDVREEQEPNMFSISVTLLVFQPDRSRDVREEQLKNMLPMLVTLLVFQPERPPRDVREEQP